MVMKKYLVTYEFVSTRAEGDNFFYCRTQKAKNYQKAEIAATLLGWKEFGELFTENCVNWIVTEIQKIRAEDISNLPRTI